MAQGKRSVVRGKLVMVVPVSVLLPVVCVVQYTRHKFMMQIITVMRLLEGVVDCVL